MLFTILGIKDIVFKKQKQKTLGISVLAIELLMNSIHSVNVSDL